MNFMHLSLLIGLSGMGTVSAQEDGPSTADIGERDRLSDEMRQLAKRQIWAGVERKYNQLIELGVEILGEDHLAAAYSARELGHLEDVHNRLSLAAASAPTKEVIDWLWDIDHNYARVVLIADKKGSAVLTVDSMPLDPNQRKAVERAISETKDTGRFEGFLPRGRYVFATQPFSVDPGVGVRVEVSPKMRRNGGVRDDEIRDPDNPTAVGQ
jgi:hypothetical protein